MLSPSLKLKDFFRPLIKLKDSGLLPFLFQPSDFIMPILKITFNDVFSRPTGFDPRKAFGPDRFFYFVVKICASTLTSNFFVYVYQHPHLLLAWGFHIFNLFQGRATYHIPETTELLFKWTGNRHVSAALEQAFLLNFICSPCLVSFLSKNKLIVLTCDEVHYYPFVFIFPSFPLLSSLLKKHVFT